MENQKNKQEKLFEAIDETSHDYTWDYTTSEYAIALLDVNDKYLALITSRTEIADETGAMGDYRNSQWYKGYLYSKCPLQPVSHESFQSSLEELSSERKENLISEIEKLTNSPGVKKLESIALSLGTVYISNGDLVLSKVGEVKN